MICLKRMEFIIMMSFFSIKDVRTLYHLKSMLKSRKVYGGCPDTRTPPLCAPLSYSIKGFECWYL